MIADESWPGVVILAFLAGLYIGGRIEALIWRAKAKGYFRKKSGGKFYSVKEDP